MNRPQAPLTPARANIVLAQALRAKGQLLGQRPMQQVLASIPIDHIPNQPPGVVPQS